MQSADLTEKKEHVKIKKKKNLYIKMDKDILAFSNI